MFGWEFPPFNSGGLGVACLGLTRAMAEIGYDVAFVMPKKLHVDSPYARFVFADEATGGGITEHSMDIFLSPYITSKQYLRERRHLMESAIYGTDLFSEVMRYAAKGAAIAEQEPFDIIYAHDWLSFAPAIEAKRVSGKPLIVHVHATEYDRCGGAQGVNPYVFGVEKDGMEAADVVIAVSGLTRDIIIHQYGIAPEKVRVVYNGIDEITAPTGGTGLMRLRALKAAGSKIVLFLGRITLQKGPDYFLRAAARVLAHDRKVVFVVAGSGDMEDSAMRLAAELGIADRVLFTGFLTGADKHEMYESADLFIMPSVSEPFGIAPLEAMRAGTPVLISKQSGVSEVVHHALKADFWDVDEMANMILSVVAHPELSETMTGHATDEVNGLTWQRAATSVDSIIQELIGSVE